MAETVSIAKEREYLNCSDSNAAPSDNDHRGHMGDTLKMSSAAGLTGMQGITLKERDRKIGHRRVNVDGIVSYKKKPTSELQEAIQLGIGQSVGGLSSKPERDVLMQDFAVVEVVFFPSVGGSNTPAHHCCDFRFKTYAPVAFRYFRDLFGIQPDDFMLSLCVAPLTELSNPGVSGSIFYCTHDDEFIIKTVQHKEADFLQKLLPGYFLNISQNKRTLLPKFYGLYCYQCSGKNIRFVVMNNLLPSTVSMHEKFDLKGSTYKRKASKRERAKRKPTLKDLDFLEIHPDSIILEPEMYDALIKTLQRDCRVLESFKIMDYSLLVGIYNLDRAAMEKAAELEADGVEERCPDTTVADGDKPTTATTGLSRVKSLKTRIGQFSTPMESIQATNLCDKSLDDDVPLGGIPARNTYGEELLLYLGIIDILQSFRLKKRLEHTMKAMVIDGDTVSVHRPSFYAQRFLTFKASKVFRKAPTALKHTPLKKRPVRTRHLALNDDGPEPYDPVPLDSTWGVTQLIDQQGPASVMSCRPDVVVDAHVHASHPNQMLSDSDSGVRVLSTHRTVQQYNVVQEFNAVLSGHLTDETAFRASDVYSAGGVYQCSPPLSTAESTPTHTEYTEGSPSFTASSLSCSSDAHFAVVTHPRDVDYQIVSHAQARHQAEGEGLSSSSVTSHHDGAKSVERHQTSATDD